MWSRNGWLWHVVVLNACTKAYAAFSFQWTEPTECGTMTVTWSGGLPPYTLLIVPEHAAMITSQIPSYNWDAATFSLQLPLPQGKRMVMTMSDGYGFASSGVSEIVVVGASNGTTCDDADAPAFNFATPENLQQCSPFIINGYTSGALYPVTLHAFVPGGTTLTLPGTGDTINWKANAPAGTTMIFSITDVSGRAGGTSDFLTVANSTDTSCFDTNAPSSISSFPATTASSTSSTSSSSINPPSSSSPPTSTQSASPSSSQTASASSGLSRNTLAAVVVGTVIGGLVVLAVVLSLVWCRRRASRDGEIVDLADDPPTPTPGIYEPTPYSLRGSPSYKHVSTVSTPLREVSDLDAISSSQPSAGTAAAAGGPSLTRELSTTSALMPTTYIVHTDAENARRNVVELPPQYDERRLSGLLDVPNSAHVDGVLQSPTVTPSEKNALVGSPPHEPMS